MTKIPNFNSDQLNIKDTFEPEEEVLLSISKAAKIKVSVILEDVRRVKSRILLIAFEQN